MKKILLLGDINSSHIQKWASGVASLGYETAIFSMSPSEFDWYSGKNIRLLDDNTNLKVETFSKDDFSKLSYIKFIRSLNKVIKSFSPDIIHSHYATSYGMLGALTNKHPYLISFWGSDIFDFPGRSLFHRLFIKYIINKADIVLSTSKVMKNEIGKYTSKPVEITPFGIDLDQFYNFRLKEDDVFTIGIIKSLEKHYGIDNLIRAFELVVKKYKDKKLKLLIVGDGSLMAEYIDLVAQLKLENKVTFTGRISQEEAPAMHNRIDLFVCPSLRESFGVSVLEASACEVPVIVTNVGGLPEVVLNNETGIILKTHDIKELADSICYFLENPSILSLFGKRGRKFVEDNYDWKRNLVLINDIYKRILKIENKT